MKDQRTAISSVTPRACAEPAAARGARRVALYVGGACAALTAGALAGQAGAQTFNATGAAQTLNVAQTTEYVVTVSGAQGGNGTSPTTNAGGAGATLSGTVIVTSGDMLNIIVGSQGGSASGFGGGGGGGGSFVIDTTSGQLLVAAGGGGGGGAQNGGGQAGQITTYGTSGNGSGAGAGGAGGSGGQANPNNHGGAGGGYLSAGQNSIYSGAGGGGSAPGFAGGAPGPNGQAGGYGGGGGSTNEGGGGGGYSGGGGGSGYLHYGGGGGGSYTAASFNLLSATAGANLGNGVVSFQALGNIDTGQPSYAASAVGVTVSSIFAGGVLRVDQPGQTYAANFYVDHSGTSAIDGAGKTSVFSGVFADAATGVPGSLIIKNSGVGGAVVFTGANTYSGPTTITSGATLQIGNGGTTGSVAGPVVDNGALVFDLNGNGVVNNQIVGAVVGNLISGTGSVTVGGANGVIAVTANNTYTGGTTINVGGFLGLGNVTTGGTVAGNIVDNGRLGMNHSVAFTFGGNISGSGYLTSGGIATTLTGTNTYTGGTYVFGGTLQIGNGTTAGSIVGDVGLSTGTTLIFDHADTVTFPGVISGQGGLTQAGTGLLVLNAVNTYGGLTNVSSGALEVGDATHTGASLAGSVVVGAAGTLQGHGQILGSVTNTAGGVVSPGGTIGTLTVGSYSQGANSTLAIEVSPSAASLLHVTGAASLNGALKLNFDAGTYSGLVVPVVTAGSISGTFSSVSGAPGLADGLVYASGHVSLVVEQTRAGQVFGDLTTSTLDQVHTLADLVADRAGECGGPLAQIEGGTGGMSATSTGATAKSRECGPTSAWMQAFGRTDQVDASTTADRFNATDGGVVGGVERRLPGQAAVGVAFAYAHTSLDVGGSAASANADSYFASLYGRGVYHGVEVDAQVFYQVADWSTSRAVAGYGSASASPHANTTGGLIQVSYPIAAGDVHPYVRFSFAQLDRSGAVETGVGPLGLTTASASYDSARGELGFKFAHTYVSRGMTWSPELRVGVENEFATLSHDATAALTGVTNSPAFRAPSAQAQGAAAVVIGDLKAQLSDRLSLFGDLRGRFTTGQTEALVSFGARLSF